MLLSKPAPQRTVSAQDQNAIVLHPLLTLPYVYTFVGKVFFQGSPCANAHVVVRVIYGDENAKMEEAYTSQDGSFSIPVTIITSPNTAIDWRLEADGKGFQKLEKAGRRITTQAEETAVTVQTSVNFVSTAESN